MTAPQIVGLFILVMFIVAVNLMVLSLLFEKTFKAIDERLANKIKAKWEKKEHKNG